MNINIVLYKPSGNHKAKTYRDSQKIKKRESKHTTIRNHQFTVEGSKRGKRGMREQQNSQKKLTKWK